MEAILFLVVWYLSGIASFIWWWTKDYDFGPVEVFMSIFVGLAGPVAFVMGWIIHGAEPSSKNSKVLIKRRG